MYVKSIVVHIGKFLLSTKTCNCFFLCFYSPVIFYGGKLYHMYMETKRKTSFKKIMVDSYFMYTQESNSLDPYQVQIVCIDY